MATKRSGVSLWELKKSVEAEASGTWADLEQQAQLKCHQTQSRQSGNGLYNKTVVNLARDFLKSGRVKYEHSHIDPTDSGPTFEVDDPGIRLAEDRTQEDLETSCDVTICLEKIDPQMREALQGNLAGGMSNEEAGKILGVGRTKARQVIQEATDTMRSKLGDYKQSDRETEIRNSGLKRLEDLKEEWLKVKKAEKLAPKVSRSDGIAPYQYTDESDLGWLAARRRFRANHIHGRWG